MGKVSLDAKLVLYQLSVLSEHVEAAVAELHVLLRLAVYVDVAVVVFASKLSVVIFL